MISRRHCTPLGLGQCIHAGGICPCRICLTQTLSAHVVRLTKAACSMQSAAGMWLDCVRSVPSHSVSQRLGSPLQPPSPAYLATPTSRIGIMRRCGERTASCDPRRQLSVLQLGLVCGNQKEGLSRVAANTNNLHHGRRSNTKASQEVKSKLHRIRGFFRSSATSLLLTTRRGGREADGGAPPSRRKHQKPTLRPAQLHQGIARG